MSGHACGFTLLEFLIALAIVSVALGIGIPALDYLIRQQQIAATITICWQPFCSHGAKL